MMNTQSVTEDDAILVGQARIWRYIYGVFDSMAIRCCVELRIADIISNHNRPITLSEIASCINSPSIDVDGLGRLMRFLVHRKVFDEEDSEQETVYSLNHCSKWLLNDSKVTLAPLFNRIFNEGMVCTAKITMEAVISSYRNGFLTSKGSVVDVGGGMGVAISEIVKAYPHLKGINFDLPHVISTAPTYDGVTHVAGDMFNAIPPAEMIFMKWILHNWSDEDCVKILKNCRKAVPKETGKVIIVEIVQHPLEDDPFNYTRVAFDLVMFAYFPSGRERSENDWKKLLGECGFFRYNIIKMSTLLSIIEAFP
ncbi:hypothetical protein L1887_27493 [Cichorium endivia]|nr:hypothetical protein L1887_27493 [Cichorium endivia]